MRTCAGPTAPGGGSTLDDPYRHARKPSLERARLPSIASFPAPQEAASGTGPSLASAVILPVLGYLFFFCSYNIDSSHLLSFQQILSSPSGPRSTVVSRVFFFLFSVIEPSLIFLGNKCRNFSVSLLDFLVRDMIFPLFCLMSI